MSEFKREHRYLVLKKKEIDKVLSANQKIKLGEICQALIEARQADGKPQLQCVVVQSNWPEYETIWDMIQARVEDPEYGLFGTPAGPLHKADAPQTSIDAAGKVNTEKLEEFVFLEILNGGVRGATIKEICAANPDVKYPSISARPCSLERKGFIYYQPDEKRDGARVMRITGKAHDIMNTGGALF